MNFFTSKEIKPAGWLAAQLRVQADGLCGNLDRVWDDVRDSMWIGGEREGWERVPYWLDGFIPLAYLLNDEDMIARAKKYIDAIVSHQQDDGWLCPCTPEERKTYDTWAVQLISKTLTVYYDCSGDERIPPVLYKMLKNYYDLLSSGEIKLFGWGQYRWFETFVALNFLSEYCGDTWIAELAHILDAQGKDYNTISDRFVKPKNEWTLDTHVVNLAMMLRIEPLTDKLLCGKYRGCAKRLYEFIMKYNGTCVDIFTGDEDIVFAGRKLRRDRKKRRADQTPCMVALDGVADFFRGGDAVAHLPRLSAHHIAHKKGRGFAFTLIISVLKFLI